MKASSLLLVASLAINALLVASFIVPGRSPRPSLTGADHSAASGVPVSHAANGKEGGGSGKADAETWTRFQPQDPAALLHRLQAEGFPLKIAQALAAAEIRAQFAPRRQALNLKENERPFWESNIQDPQTAAAMREITKEETQAIRDLLGPDAYRDEYYMTTLRRQFPGLSDEKINQLNLLQMKRNEQQSDLMANFAGGMISAADSEKLRAIDKEQHAEIAKVLTPEELEEYDLRTSNIASSLRYSLSAFDATEQEFRTLYQLRAAFDDRLGAYYAAPSQEEMKARADAQQELNQQIKAALGDERYADYQRATDYNYQQTSKLVARLDLPAEAANQVWAVQQDLQQRATATRSDRTLSAQDRNQQLAALADEAQNRVSAVLGERGFEAYRQYGGNWMITLQPARPAPAPARASGGTIIFKATP